MADIFISHASSDALLVDALVQLIEGGIGIASTQIFCTSLEEQGVPPGVDFKSHIKERLGEARTVVAVVSPRYYNSAFCMCELGATWALAKDFIPLLVPPVDYSDLRGTLFGTQVLPVDRDEKLDSMHTVIARLTAHPESVVRWNSRKAQFLQKLPDVLKTLKPVTTLSEKDAEQLKSQLKNYKHEFLKADEEIATLKQQIAELVKVKDKQSVDEIRQKYSKGSDRFNELIKNAQKSTSRLPKVVCEALYHYFRDEEFAPDYDSWHDAPQLAAEQKLLRQDEGVYSANHSHPKIRKAIDDLEDLRKFLKKPPDDFAIADYENEYEDILSLSNRTFWERHKLF